jgi:hypothetical protein
MGYAVYITRARHHLEGSQAPIPQEDWRALIESDPGLTAERNRPDLARWAGPATVDNPSIDWANGNLFSRDPDHSVIRKLIDVAGLLGGRVQGDDGELYSIERGRVVSEVPEKSERAASADPETAAPFEGIEPQPPDIDDALAEEELEAALGALSSYAAASLEETPLQAVPEDPNASFARPPEDAIEQDSGKQATAPMPFTVGQRVQTPWGRPATVVGIDPDADWGMGRIEIKYDDGRTATTSCMTHGLSPL